MFSNLVILTLIPCLVSLTAAAPVIDPPATIPTTDVLAAGLGAGQGAHAIIPLGDVEVATENAVVHRPKASTSRTIVIVPTTAAPSPLSLPTGASGPAVSSPGGLAFFAADPSKGPDPKNPAVYTCLRGPASRFPHFSSWVPFETMFAINRPAMATFEGPDIIKHIHDSILKISAAGKVDARLVLAQIMQESTGNVHVPCTYNGVINCGIMQAFIGSVSFNPADPAKSIVQMIKDGVQGTARGGGMVQAINEPSTHGNVYIALRKYNSGKANLADLSDPMGATASYVSDMANRVQGWNGIRRGRCFS